MQRCMQCNSPLTSAETVCYSCNSPVVKKNRKEFSDRFRTTINAVFISFAVVTVAAAVTAVVPGTALAATTGTV